MEPHGAVLASYITPKAIAASSHDRTMVTLINHDPDNRFTIAVGRKSVELARATV